MKTTVVMPTYNEADNLVQIVAELMTLGLDDLHLLIIDDNSPDGTGKMADDLAAQYPERVEVIHRRGKMGLGTAYVTGFCHAIESGSDAVIQMDADFSHSPAYIPAFLDKIRECDVVIGSRYVADGKVDERWSIWRRFLSWGGNVYARLITGLRINDVTSGYRCFRRDALTALDLDRIRSEGYAFQIEVAYACQRKGLRLVELPIYFEDRSMGLSKMSWRIILEATWRVWQMRWRYRNRERPSPPRGTS
ncbi:MAG: polyprenol monophosphomannose synthase [Anaerolineae bacterium]|nr:polyprenol monophosphomannose synthase [Anaerolineae bacterium]